MESIDGELERETLPLSDTAVEAFMWVCLVMSWPLLAYAGGFAGLITGILFATFGLLLAVVALGRQQVEQGLQGMAGFLGGSLIAFAIRYLVFY